MVTITLQDFLADSQGKKYPDVAADRDFNKVIEFFNNEDRQQRMLAAPHFKVPALGGIIVELEAHPDFKFLHDNAGITLTCNFSGNRSVTYRFRQAIGVVAKIIMEKHGWAKTGTKGSLRSLAKFFRLSEIYQAPKNYPSA